MQKIVHKLPLAAVIVSASLLAGCSGSSNSISSSLGGVGVDGYIVGATVFLDLNNNLTRDSNEPQSITGAGGTYSLDTTGLSTTQIAAGKIVLTGGTDDSTGAAFTSILTAKTDGTTTNVPLTPLTSLLASLVESGETLSSAKTKLATALGVPANLIDQDPIANAANNPDLLKQAVALQKAMEVLAKAEANGGDEKAALTTIANKIATQAKTENNLSATSLIDKTTFTGQANNAKELAKDTAKLVEAVLETAKANGGLSESELNRQIKVVQAAIDKAKEAAPSTNNGERLDSKLGSLTGSLVTLVNAIKDTTTINGTTVTSISGIVSQAAKEKETGASYSYPTISDSFSADQLALLMAINDKVEDKVKALAPDTYRTIMQEFINLNYNSIASMIAFASEINKTPYEILNLLTDSTPFKTMPIPTTGTDLSNYLLSIPIINSTSVSGATQTNSNSGSNSPLISFSGKAADGYLRNAKVCLDTNNNGKCDDGEPATTTGSGGEFTIETPPLFLPSDYPIVVEVSSNTIDEDKNQTVGGSYTLSARAGQYAFVSPITTLVNNTVAANPAIKPEEALAQIRSRLGVVDSGLSDSVDYIAKTLKTSSASPAEMELYHGAHLVAQGIANVLKDTNATTNTGDNAKYSQMVVNEFISGQLAAIAEDIQNNKTNTITGITSLINGSSSVIDNNVAKKIDTSSAILPSTSEIISLMKDGLYWIENSNNWKAMGVSYATSNSTTSSGTMVSKETGLTPAGWSTPNEGDEIILNPNTNTWVKSNSTNKPTRFTIADDGTFLLSSRYYEEQTARGAVIDLAGKSIAEKVNAYTSWTLSNNSSNFSNGAKAIVFNRINKTEGWTIHINEPNDNTCNNKQIKPVENNCNIVQVNGSNVTTLSNLANNTVGVNGNSVVRFNQDGTRASFYTNWNWQNNTGTLVTDVAVNTINKGSTSFIALPFPASLRDKTEEDMVIFAVVDSVVRIGRHRAKDDIATSILFNKTAAENVLTAAGLPAMPNWQ